MGSLDSIMALFDPVGTSWGSSLSWSQSAALARTAENTGRGLDLTPVIRELRWLGQDIYEVTQAVASLERKMGLRLDAQTEILDKQLDVLQQIVEILRNPVRTRAAERVRVANELLRHRRNDRALAAAEEAIGDDPNNDLAFIVAGWAAFGLKQFERALEYFREARQATSGTKGAEGRNLHAACLAARLTFALEGPEAAWQELGAAWQELGAPAIRHLPHDAYDYAMAFYYDQAAYAAATQRTSEAIRLFTECATQQFCYLALTDPILTQNEEVVAAVRNQLSTFTKLINRARDLIDTGAKCRKELCAFAEKHQLKDFVPRIAWFMPEEHSHFSGFFEGCHESTIRSLIESMSSQLKDLGSWIEHDPRVDREMAKESILTSALENMTSRTPADFLLQHRRVLLFRGRVDAIISERGLFAPFYLYLVADPAKPLICVRTYEMTAEEYERALSEIIRNDSSRGRDEPRLSPLISQRPKAVRSTKSWHWNKDSTSHAWPDDDQ